MRRALSPLFKLPFPPKTNFRPLSTSTPPIPSLPANFTPSDVASALRSLRDPSAASALFDFAASHSRYRHTSATYHLMLRILVSHRRFARADSLVDAILSGACPDANRRLFHDIVCFFCARNHLFSALDVLNRMLHLGGDRAPTAETYSAVLDAILRQFDLSNSRFVYLRSVKSLVRMMVGSGVRPDANVMDLVARAYAKCGEVDGALKVFDEMSQCGYEPGEKAYGCLVEGLVKEGRVDNGLRLLGEMRGKGFVPTTKVFTSVMNGLSMEGRFGEAAEVLDSMLQNGKTPELVTYRTLLEGLCRVGRKEEAFGMLEVLKGRRGALSDRTHRYLLDGLHWLCQDPKRM